MKEATGELNMTVIVILIIAALGALIMGVLNNATFRQALTDRFTGEITGQTTTGN